MSGVCTPAGTTLAVEEVQEIPAVSAALLGLGAACIADEQCSQEGGEVACRDNGLPADGERNCCRYTGGACVGDAGCCIGLQCLDGICQV